MLAYNEIDPDKDLYQDDLEVIIKFRYYIGEPFDYKLSQREREREWQNEYLYCCRCRRDIRRRDGYWFQYHLHSEKKYTNLPARVTYIIVCVDCIEESIVAFTRQCQECHSNFYIPKIDSLTQHCDQCRTLYSNEAARVRWHLDRARKAGVAATLTPDEWKKTVADFNRMCAYCQKRAFLTIDHFTPMSDGGGTTAQNCVPCCKFCNDSKGYRSPESILGVSKEVVANIRVYLAGR